MPFRGFSKRTLSFFADLKKNNTREWFGAHRKEYEDHVLAPARAFVTDFGDALKKLEPGIIAAPKINRSLFRINRDTRFSADKSPYKTNMGLFFWEGNGPRMECSGVYVHMEPPGRFMVGVGLYMFSRPLLDRYRRAVVDEERGGDLADIVGKIEEDDRVSLGGRHYKRVPAGFPADHPRAGLLLHNGLYAGLEGGIPPAFHSPGLVDFCIETAEPFLPLHRWLVGLTEGG
jgi:uncharacterized protein (TIGR02453 family)